MRKRKQYKFCQLPDLLTPCTELPGVSLRDRALWRPPSLRFGATPRSRPLTRARDPSPPCRVAIASVIGMAPSSPFYRWRLMFELRFSTDCVEKLLARPLAAIFESEGARPAVVCCTTRQQCELIFRLFIDFGLFQRYRPFSVIQLRIWNGSSCPIADRSPPLPERLAVTGDHTRRESGRDFALMPIVGPSYCPARRPLSARGRRRGSA
jgi:hypothetical protein